MKLKLLAGLALLYTGHVQATTVLYVDLNQLTQESEGIVIGTVAKTESTYGFNKSIYTFVTFNNLEEVKGRVKGPELTLRLEGGRVDKDILEIDGSPRFQNGERVMLFVRGNGKAKVPLVGWTQGVFKIVKDDISGADIVEDYDGNKLLGISGKDLVKERRAQPEARILSPVQGLASRQSAPAAANPGVQDNGGESAQASPNQAPGATPLSPDQFLGDIKARLAATANAKAASATAAVESAGLPDTVPNTQDLAAPDARASGQAKTQGESGQPTLPRPTPVQPDPNKQ